MAVLLSTTNGGTVADATDSFDAMDKLISFLTGVTGTLPVIQRWTVNKDDTTSVPGERFVYLRGPGLSGTDSIYVNIRVYSDVPANLHNWQIRGATGFDTNADFNNQPNGSPITTVSTLSNATMPFWFVANGRRFITVFQTAGSVSYASYFGWYLPYATPSEFPYPMYNGGNVCDTDLNYLLTDYRIGNAYDGPFRTTNAASGQLRHRDGSWISYGGFIETLGAFRPTGYNAQFTSRIWPHDNSNQVPYGFNIIENADEASFSIFPFMLYSLDNGGNVYGELDGMFFSPLGLIGKRFPDTITVGSDTYLVVNNAYRTEEANAVILLK